MASATPRVADTLRSCRPATRLVGRACAAVPRAAAARSALAPLRNAAPRRSPRSSAASRRGAARASATAETAETALILSERKRFTREVAGQDALDALGGAAPDNYYTLLRVAPGASFAEVKAAYRALAKLVHPDVVGAEAHDLAIVLNLANATLTDEAMRMSYDAALSEWRSVAGSFDGVPVSVWQGSEEETDAVFVDECACIGCGKCANVAPATFAMEDVWGRARVHTQWADSRELIAEAIATCPVETISYVKRTEVALLEFMMKQCRREDIAIITRRRAGNFGSSSGNDDPFSKAAHFLQQRRNAEVGEKGRLRRAAQDDALAATIAKAWLALDPELRERIWPEAATQQ
jgi:ferredoxin